MTDAEKIEITKIACGAVFSHGHFSITVINGWTVVFYNDFLRMGACYIPHEWVRDGRKADIAGLLFQMVNKMRQGG